MTPFARFAFYWEDAGQNYFNVSDNTSSVYCNKSTISQNTVEKLGLPIVKTEEDEAAIIDQDNRAFWALRQMAGVRS